MHALTIPAEATHSSEAAEQAEHRVSSTQEGIAELDLVAEEAAADSTGNVAKVFQGEGDGAGALASDLREVPLQGEADAPFLSPRGGTGPVSLLEEEPASSFIGEDAVTIDSNMAANKEDSEDHRGYVHRAKLRSFLCSKSTSTVDCSYCSI